MRNLAVLRSNKNWQEVNNQCMTTWRSPVFSSHWVLGNYIIFVNLKSVSHNRTDQAIWAVPKSRFKIGHFKEWPTRFPNFFAWSLMWNLNYLMYFLRNFIDFFFLIYCKTRRGQQPWKVGINLSFEAIWKIPYQEEESCPIFDFLHDLRSNSYISLISQFFYSIWVRLPNT